MREMKWGKFLSIGLLILGFSGLGSEGKYSAIRFHPQNKEGYFQGWNFSFRNENTVIFVTFLVSNLGPGSRNNGISVYIQNPQTDVIYRTHEYSRKELKVTPGIFGQKSRDSSMERKGNKFLINIRTEDLDMDIVYDTKGLPPYLLSGGEHKLENQEGFLRADVGFPLSPAKVRLAHNGKDLFWEGKGGMEHLNTDVEVYKFSSRWEILRAYATDGSSVFFGGYHARTRSEKGFQRILVISPQGKLILEDEIQKIEILQKTENLFSGYKIPTKQRLHLKNNPACEVLLQDKKLMGEINVLSNISAVLKVLIRLFFAKPYQIHYDTKLDLDCPGLKVSFPQGLHSYYLINPYED